ncbi:hypothetical protein CR201_G0024493 [Pongo abelii]|uniref:Uncharacterized protein n=1 Tax=Pongo abelii TaxID=9601 RepID=A0A2J8UV21_PONAB|nr:hypothetical protein CR201_G0024493 [Pongo abelii]
MCDSCEVTCLAPWLPSQRSLADSNQASEKASNQVTEKASNQVTEKADLSSELSQASDSRGPGDKRGSPLL